MATRRNSILKYSKQGTSRRNALLKLAKGPTRREALLKIIGKIPWMITKFKNTKGRPFYVTLKGTYIIRSNGKSLYGRKSNSCNVPSKIRRKRCS